MNAQDQFAFIVVCSTAMGAPTVHTLIKHTPLENRCHASAQISYTHLNVKNAAKFTSAKQSAA